MNLFQKYGGVPAVSKIVNDFYREIMARPSLRGYFAGVDMARLIGHQVRFMSFVLGQPSSVYDGRSLKAAHGRLSISDQDFNEVASVLEGALRRAGMADEDIATVMTTVASVRADVTSS